MVKGIKNPNLKNKNQKPKINKDIKIIIDEFFDTSDNNLNNFSILQEDKKIYKMKLNKSDLKQNNNKFYIIEIICDKNTYILYTRYGRVSSESKGVVNKKLFVKKEDAIKAFDKTVKSKTKKNYIEVKINIVKNDNKNKNNNNIENDLINYDNNLVNLIKLIFDKSVLRNDLENLGFDSNKMPLGDLSDEAFTDAFKILHDLTKAIDSNNKNQINDLNNKFFSTIPHIFERRNILSNLLDTKYKIQQKNLMLVSLKNLRYTETTWGKFSKLSNLYKSLDLNINVLNKKSELYKSLEKGLHKTHASTHYFKMKVLNIFELNKEEEYNNKIKNKVLLWHGSRISNYVGILSQSLRIAPPEAPVTGYMFGKGVYFADLSSKSAQYSIKGLKDGIGLLLLCECALGNPIKKHYADYDIHHTIKNNQSTVGNGKTIPTKYEEINSAKFYNGDLKKNTDQKGTLYYNEYVIYNTNQIKLRYLFEIKFN